MSGAKNSLLLPSRCGSWEGGSHAQAVLCLRSRGGGRAGSRVRWNFRRRPERNETVRRLVEGRQSGGDDQWSDLASVPLAMPRKSEDRRHGRRGGSRDFGAALASARSRPDLRASASDRRGKDHSPMRRGLRGEQGRDQELRARPNALSSPPAARATRQSRKGPLLHRCRSLRLPPLRLLPLRRLRMLRRPRLWALAGSRQSSKLGLAVPQTRSFGSTPTRTSTTSPERTITATRRKARSKRFISALTSGTTESPSSTASGPRLVRFDPRR